jgi:hypothetical protein
MSTFAIPRTPLERLRWTFSDGVIVVGRNLNHIRREPAQLIAELVSYRSRSANTPAEPENPSPILKLMPHKTDTTGR